MKAERRYRPLAVLFALVSLCVALAASRWVVGSLLPFWAVCCRMVGVWAIGDAESWLTLSKVGAFAALLVFGFGLLILRLWKTRRFVSGLVSVSASAPSLRLVRILAGLGLTRHVVVLATEVPLAFCFGLVRPRICLSTGLAESLTDQELRAVLLHEDSHRRHRDPLRHLLAETLAAMLFFLPAAAELRDLFVTKTELEADRRAIHLAGRPSLAGALHKILTHPLSVRLPRGASVSALSATQARIEELLGDGPPTLRLSTRRLMASTLILLAVCMLA